MSGTDRTKSAPDHAGPVVILVEPQLGENIGMDGTGTFGVQFRDVFVPDELILAEQAGPFVKRIRAGFILLQAGMTTQSEPCDASPLRHRPAKRNATRASLPRP